MLLQISEYISLVFFASKTHIRFSFEHFIHSTNLFDLILFDATFEQHVLEQEGWVGTNLSYSIRLNHSLEISMSDSRYYLWQTPWAWIFNEFQFLRAKPPPKLCKSSLYILSLHFKIIKTVIKELQLTSNVFLLQILLERQLMTLRRHRTVCLCYGSIAKKS